MNSTYYASVLPAGFVPYGEPPSSVATRTGFVKALLGSFGNVKSSFYFRVGFWEWPNWQFVDVPMPVQVYHASLVTVGSQLFLYGVTEFGDGYQSVPGYVPYGMTATLTARLRPAVRLPAPATSEMTQKRLYPGMIDDLWRRHCAAHGWLT